MNPNAFCITDNGRSEGRMNKSCGGGIGLRRRIVRGVIGGVRRVSVGSFTLRFFWLAFVISSRLYYSSFFLLDSFYLHCPSHLSIFQHTPWSEHPPAPSLPLPLPLLDDQVLGPYLLPGTSPKLRCASCSLYVSLLSSLEVYIKNWAKQKKDLIDIKTFLVLTLLFNLGPTLFSVPVSTLHLSSSVRSSSLQVSSLAKLPTPAETVKVPQMVRDLSAMQGLWLIRDIY